MICKLSTNKTKLSKEIEKVVVYTPYTNKPKPNTLTYPKTHINESTNFKIRLSKINFTHIHIHKERNNKTNTIHSQFKNIQNHDLNTNKILITDLLKHTNIYTKNPTSYISRNKHLEKKFKTPHTN